MLKLILNTIYLFLICLIVDGTKVKDLGLQAQPKKQWSKIWSHSTILSRDYLLLEDPKDVRGMQERSVILDCTKVDHMVDPDADPCTLRLKSKFITDCERFQRELHAQKLLLKRKKSHPSFVQLYASDIINKQDSDFLGCTIMESGWKDLKSLSKLAGQIDGLLLKFIAIGIVQAMNKLHSRGMVWCDLKLDNFVLVDNSKDQELTSCLEKSFCVSNLLDAFHNGDIVVKAIDLESSVSFKKPIQDFSPEVSLNKLCIYLYSFYDYYYYDFYFY